MRGIFHPSGIPENFVGHILNTLKGNYSKICLLM
jgi:hypothetical protein